MSAADAINKNYCYLPEQQKLSYFNSFLSSAIVQCYACGVVTLLIITHKLNLHKHLRTKKTSFESMLFFYFFFLISSVLVLFCF